MLYTRQMKLALRSTRWPLLGICLCVVGVRFWLIGTYGNPVPFWDQWDAEATAIYLPWTEGTLEWRSWFAAHNEHRIFWTRALGLLELRLNGGIWDPLFQMTVNALLHGLALLVFLDSLSRELPESARRPLLFFSLTLALPFGWGNTLWGFQSQFYFLLLFGLLSIRWLTASVPLSRMWWRGFLALGAASFSVASGFLAGPAVAAGYVFRMFLDRKIDKRTCWAIALLLGYAVVAYAFTPTVSANAPFRANGSRAFVTAFLKAVAVPFDSYPAMVAWVQFPLAWLFFHLLYGKHRPQAKPIPWFLIGTATWIFLNAAATAYGRGAGGEGPASRFMDTLFLLPVINFAAFLYLAHPFPGRRANIALWGWTLVQLGGMAFVLGTFSLKSILEVAQGHQIRAANAAQFMAKANRNHFAQLPFYALPFYPADRLADLLENQTVRHFLPTEMRDALPVRQTNAWFFLERGVPPDVPPRPFERVWGSYGPGGPALTGERALDFDPPRKGGFLEIAIAGQPREEGMVLRIESLDGRLLADLVPRHNPGNQWELVHIRSPREPFRIVAKDASSRHWLAFAMPKEIGPGTLVARAVLRHWYVFFGAGLLFCLGKGSAREL